MMEILPQLLNSSNSSDRSKSDSAKVVSYGDARAHVLLWQKAIFLFPVWALIAIPLTGLLLNCLGVSVMQNSFGVVIAALFVYFVEDLLKRKIRMDDDYLYFGFKTLPIREIVNVEVLYKRHKFLPTHLSLNTAGGKRLKFSLNGLTDNGVEVLIKHLQAKNSTLEASSVIATLVKFRKARVKPLETPEYLELPIQSRRVLSQAASTYIGSAGKWIRTGPLLTLVICSPMWLYAVSGLYVLFLRKNWSILENLGSFKFLATCAQAVASLVTILIYSGYEFAKPFLANPVLVSAEILFFCGLTFYVQRLFFQPNLMVADKNGLKFLLRAGFISVPVKKMTWSQISKLKLHSHRGKIDRIRFSNKNCKNLDLDLESVAPEHRALLLKRIEKMVPDCQVEDGLSEIMLPNSNQSYTEIWLQSLNQSPERAMLEPLSPGQLVGNERYEALRSLGVGGQGTAYLCRDLESEDQNLVVLKESIIPVFANHAVTVRELEKFEREAKTLKSLHHKGVVSLLEYFVEDHRAYLVLEHIDGMNLLQIIKRDGPMSEDFVRELALQMTEILVYLHSHHIIHRDFTPDNLILDSKGRLKLIDFNVVQQGESGTTGTIVGKHAYVPPEQFRGKATAGSDIYAFGATLFYLLTAKDPEPISQSNPKSIREDVSDDLNEIVKKSTFLKESDRFSNIEDIRRCLINGIASLSNNKQSAADQEEYVGG